MVHPAPSESEPSSKEPEPSSSSERARAKAIAKQAAEQNSPESRRREYELQVMKKKLEEAKKGAEKFAKEAEESSRKLAKEADEQLSLAVASGKSAYETYQ